VNWQEYSGYCRLLRYYLYREVCHLERADNAQLGRGSETVIEILSLLS